MGYSGTAGTKQQYGQQGKDELFHFSSFLKYFFVDSLHAGEGMSTINIKERIRQLLEDENPDKMLRDDEIADILQKEGINIARRTVAKYRGELGIASIKERRKRK